MAWKRWLACGIVCCVLSPSLLNAQNAPVAAASSAPVMLTLKRSLELAAQNSKDIQVARIRLRVAEQSARLTKSEFLPNLYAGSGAGYTYGLPETPGGHAPSIFSVTYTEEVLNGPLRGLAKEQEEEAKAQRLMLQDTRVAVMEHVTMAYLELLKVRHGLELLRKEKDSAEKIVDVTQQRQNEGYELPMEVTKAQLTRAQVIQRILQLEGRQDELEVYLCNQLGLATDQPIDLAAEDLPGSAEQAGANLVALAEQGNLSLAFAQSDVKAKEFRLAGEKRGYWPTLQLVSIYDVLAKYNFNNNSYYVVNDKNFRYNNLNAGISVNVPIYSTKTKASVQLAQANLDAARINLASRRTQVNAEVRQRARKLQEMDAAKEVARLELQLAQQSLTVLQSQFGEGKVNLRDVEKARLEESDKWMNYLDTNFQRQQAQIALLRTAGQLEKVLE